MAMCLPSLPVIIRHIKRVIRNGKNIKSIFVAADENHMLDEIGEALARMQVN
jgi:peptide-O-fucosyltransferase